ALLHSRRPVWRTARGDHAAGESDRNPLAINTIAAWASLVYELHFTMPGNQLSSELADRLRLVLNDSDQADLAISTSVRYRRGNSFLVQIQSHEYIVIACHDDRRLLHDPD